jgi:signal transduction histidine kinase/ActR/RegA family two-component response regulator
MTGQNSPQLESHVILLPATRRDGEAICAFLEPQRLECQVCANAAEAAAALSETAGVLILTDASLNDPMVVAITDTLSRQPDWSDIPVVLLSKAGAESLEVAKLAYTLTNVTLLDRPTSMRTLLSAILAALRSRTRQYQIRDQLLALKSAENALRLSDRRKDEFLAMLAHELRNPLAPIRTASELLPRIVPPGDSRVRSALAIVTRQVTQLSRLVDDLLDVSRITLGRIEMQRATVDVSDIVNQALESVESLVKEKNHRVRRVLARPIFVDGDRARLVQCVSNILLNAVKYTDPAGDIDVELRQQNGFAVVSIRDNGVGISPELLPRVFELFVQSERSLDRSQGGLGIGLNVAERIVGLHQGRISASSDGPGRGSTFEIRLPTVAAPPAPKAAATPIDRTSKRIMIVDDNQDAADSLASLLALEGHEVIAVYGADDALKTAAEFDAEFILLDIGLPDMDGYEVARRLRSDGTYSRLVALTGYGQPADIQRAVDAGFDSHLVKPVDFGRLEQLLSVGVKCRGTT